MKIIPLFRSFLALRDPRNRAFSVVRGAPPPGPPARGAAPRPRQGPTPAPGPRLTLGVFGDHSPDVICRIMPCKHPSGHSRYQGGYHV